MLKVLEKFWLTISLLSFLAGIYQSITEGPMSGLLLFGITLISILVYWLRHKQRLRMENKNLNKGI